MDQDTQDQTKDITIRPVRAADAFAVLQMIRSLASHHGDVPRIGMDALDRDVLGPSRWMTLLVAERDEHLLGYAALIPTAQLQHGDRGMDLHHLFVTEEERGNGLGAKLLEAAQDASARFGAVYLKVAAQVENLDAQGFYRKQGFDPRPLDHVAAFSKAL